MSNHNSHANPAPPILLAIAGFYPSCGAGTAADLKTYAAHGCYGVAAITALTVQSTQGVQDLHLTPAATLRAQLDVLVKDVEIAAVKIGMLGNRANAAAVAEFLDAHTIAHVVLDPVLKSSSGAELLDGAGVKYLTAELMKRASVITPNIDEAEALTGASVKDAAEMEAAARDRKSTRLNSSHLVISYAVFCLKKKKKKNQRPALITTYAQQNVARTLTSAHTSGDIRSA